MSIILKPSALKVKDDNGNYIGTNMFAAESTQEYLDAIETIGTQTQTAIQNKSTQAQAAIEAKAEQTIESIPGDYTELASDVTTLKQDLTIESEYVAGHYDVISKNLFDKNRVEFGKGIDSSGNIVQKTSENFISAKIEVEPSTAYCVNRNAGIYNQDGTFIELHSVSNGSNFTTPATAAYIIIASTSSLLDATMAAKGTSVPFDEYKKAIKKPLIRVDEALTEQGMPADAKKTGEKIESAKNDTISLINSFADAVLTPSTVTDEIVVIDNSAVEGIKSAETNADSIYRSGINLWDEQWELGSYSTGDGSTVYNTTNVRSKNTNPIPIHPNTDYYVKSPSNMGIMFYDALGTFLSYQTGNNKKISSPANAYYMRFYLVSGYGTTYNNDIQITFDSDADKATYHAHNNATFTDINDLTLIPNGRNYVYAIGSDHDVSITYYQSIGSEFIPKKPYQSGFIVFSVKSRLTKSNNSVSASATSEGTDDSVDVNCILKLPSTYTPNGDPTKLIMICHGAGQSAESWATNVNYIALTTAFVNAGYAVFDCNGYRENALGYSFWGDSRGVDVWRKAYQYVVDNYNVEQQFGLYGFSMGGLTALNLMFSGFPGIKCIALGSPVVSLEACYDSESVNAVIKTLYGMGNTYDASLAYGCDPYARMIEIGNKKYIFGRIPPIKMWYGSTETGTTDTGSGEVVTGVVVKAYGEAIINAINNAGGQGEYREVANAGHEICYGGNATVNNDFVLYFDRHCL